MGAPTFELRLLGAEGLHRIVVSGELDLATCPRLLAAVQDILATRPRELEIDLRGINFIDSTGLRTLIVVRDEANAAGVAFYVIPSESQQLRKVFAITSLEGQLPWRAPITDSQRGTIDGLEQAFLGDDDQQPEPAA